MPDISFRNGDVQITKMGDIAITSYSDDIIQTAVNNIDLIYGSYIFHTNIGNRIHRGRNKWSRSGISRIEDECRAAIMQDPRVHTVNSVEVTRNERPGDDKTTALIAFTITDINGDVHVSNAWIGA